MRRALLVWVVWLAAASAHAQSTNVRATDTSTKVITDVGDAANGALRVNIVAGAAAGGTSSLVAGAVPTAATAAGFSDGSNLQIGRVYDINSGGGTEFGLGVNLRRSGASGSVELLGQTTSANSLPVTIASDQSALLVGQNGNWAIRMQDGSGNGITSLSLGSQRAPTVAIVDASGNQITSFGGSGGTASNYGSAFPTAGTAIGFSDGTNMQTGRVVDLDTGAGTVYGLVTNLVRRASGGPTEMIGSTTSALSLPVVIASDQAGIPITSITTSITPGTGALNLGKAEDAAHTSGDVGVMALGVRASVATDLSAGGTNGDYVPPQFDANGRMWTNPFPASPAAGTYLPIRLTDGTSFLQSSVDYTHNVALTPATTTGPEILFRASAAAPTAVSADDVAVLGWALRNGAQAVQITAAGALIGGDATNGLKVQCISGCAGSGGTSLADRAGYVAGTTAGTPLMAARDDSTPATLGEDLVGIVRQSANRELYTILRDGAGNNRGANVDASGNLNVTVAANLAINLAQVAGGTVSTVATGVQKVGISDSGGTAFLSAANALNSTGAGLSASQVVAQFDDVSPTAITENQFGNLRMSANRNQYFTLRDGAGNERGANINAGNELLVNPYSSTPAATTYQTSRLTDGTNYLTTSVDYLQDGALTVATTTGPISMGRASAAVPSDVSNDNDAVMPWYLRSGAQAMQPTFAGVLASTGVGATGTGVQRVVDVASGTTGAAPPAQANYIAGVGSGATGGFLAGLTACDLDANVNVSTATTTLLITGVSGRKIHICSLHLVTNTANNVALIEGTGGTCGTGTAGVAGGTSAATGYTLAANGGFTLGTGIGDVMATATVTDSLCAITSAGTQLSGHIKYAIY